MTALIVFVIGGIGTYLMRASFMSIGSEVTLPPILHRSLQFVAPAVFAAIVLPSVLGDDGLNGVLKPDARVLAAAVATIVAIRTRSLPLVLVVGMGSLWILRWLGVT